MSTPAYMTPEFHQNILGIVQSHGHRHAANVLHAMAIPFEHAYELIFCRRPRELKSDDLDFTFPNLPNLPHV